MRTSDGRGAAEPDPLEEVVAAALEADAAGRDALLARLDRTEPERARRVRSRLAALGELGFALDAPRADEGAPARFGRFTRLARVGSGGMREVHLARDEATGELAAVKLVRADQARFESARRRFRREIEALARIAHPGIVRVLEVGEAGSGPWIALEWVGGASLEEVLDRLRERSPETLGPRELEDAVRAIAHGRPHPEEARAGGPAFPGASFAEVAARIVVGVARSLAAAHAAGVLHRDVKPSNVLATSTGRVLLADFGLALPHGADRLTRAGSWLGSLPYAAPEQLAGDGRALDERADVYSLGATLYELLTLRTPFLGGPEGTVRRRIATGDLEPVRRLNPAVPRALAEVCAAALDPDPRRRPRGAGELADDLERALAGEPVRARRPPLGVRLERRVRRHPVRAIALAATFVLVAGALAIAWRERALATRLTRLADAELVRGLIDESSGFAPPDPERVPAMDAWLRRSSEVLGREAVHRGALEALSLRALPYGDRERAADESRPRAELAVLARELAGLARFVEGGGREARSAPPTPEAVRALDEETAALVSAPAEELGRALRARLAHVRSMLERDAARWSSDLQQLHTFELAVARADRELAGRRSHRFASALDAWRHAALRRLCDDLVRLRETEERVRGRLAATRALERIASESAGAWERARAAIAVSPRYAGLEVGPIFGLVPLGEDPASGLHEFLLAASGEAPAAEGAGVGEETGIVLVLLPGGRFRMGSDATSERRFSSAQPAHEVELAPFLLAKHELTVAQAERLGGLPEGRPRPEDGRLPLAIDGERGRALLLEHGLELPTEAQWEFAARAGGASGGSESLEGRANVADRTLLADVLSIGPQFARPTADFDDGWVGAAPVGSFLPNAFGLYDVHGNLAEWCRDAYVVRGYSTLTPRGGDGLRATVLPAPLRAVRGGGFLDRPEDCAPEVRTGQPPSSSVPWIGLRGARSVDG